MIRSVVTWLLILAGALEAVWGLLQVYGLEPSNHSLYALTGSFYNPDPYSGFLAMCLPLALHEWLQGRRIWKHVALVALVLMTVVLPSGMSRSAWLAALVACAMGHRKVWVRWMALEKEARVESTAVRQMREEVKEMLEAMKHLEK